MDRDQVPYRAVRRAQNRCNQIDAQELLKQEIYKQTFDDAVSTKINPTGLGSVLSGGGGGVGGSTTNGGYGFEDTEIYFDSLASDGASARGNGELLWSIGQLNNNNDIQNAIEMKIGSFFFPRLASPIGQPDIFFYRRMYMRVATAPTTQAVHLPNSNVYHFEFDVYDLNSIAVKLVPVKDTFFFTRPLSSLSAMQVRFMLPSTFAPVPLLLDTVVVQSVFPGMVSPAQFTIIGGPTTANIGPIGAQPPPGVAVFLTGYNSNDTATNNNVNNPLGWFVINIIDAFNFTVTGIDTTATIAPYNATMVIGKNRIGFQVRFTSVRNQMTNFITVSHE